MGYRRLGLAAVAAVSLIIAIAAKPEPARATGALALATTHAGLVATAPAEVTGPLLIAHFRRAQSFYCYPKNYWWFYRPYTTAYDDHARCMPYFHYLEPGRGAKSERYIK
jgi:hypothetical protein